MVSSSPARPCILYSAWQALHYCHCFWTTHHQPTRRIPHTHTPTSGPAPRLPGLIQQEGSHKKPRTTNTNLKLSSPPEICLSAQRPVESLRTVWKAGSWPEAIVTLMLSYTQCERDSQLCSFAAIHFAICVKETVHKMQHDILCSALLSPFLPSLFLTFISPDIWQQTGWSWHLAVFLLSFYYSDETGAWLLPPCVCPLLFTQQGEEKSVVFCKSNSNKTQTEGRGQGVGKKDPFGNISLAQKHSMVESWQ